MLERRGNDFKTPGEMATYYPSAGEFDVPHMISWADTERDLSAWLGNAMQSNALHELYRLEPAVKESGDEQLLEDWRYLQTSDHFYYMSTKHLGDGTVPQVLQPLRLALRLVHQLHERARQPARPVGLVQHRWTCSGRPPGWPLTTTGVPWPTGTSAATTLADAI